MTNTSATIIGTVLIAAVLMTGCASQPRRAMPQTGFLFRTVAATTGTMKYAVYVPREYDGSKDWPCILFLHGSGESGGDGLKQCIQGLGSAIQWDAKAWPFIVIFPQKPVERKQWEDYDAAVMGALAATKRELRVDDRRVYLTGLSQGGHGTWMFAAAHPEIWAAIAPACGYISRDDGPPDRAAADAIAAKVARLPVWAFHGEADDVVPPEQTRVQIEAAKAARAGITGPAEVKASFYPGVNHGCWDKAYREERLAAWFLSHTRP